MASTVEPLDTARFQSSKPQYDDNMFSYVDYLVVATLSHRIAQMVLDDAEMSFASELALSITPSSWLILASFRCTYFWYVLVRDFIKTFWRAPSAN